MTEAEGPPHPPQKAGQQEGGRKWKVGVVFSQDRAGCEEAEAVGGAHGGDLFPRKPGSQSAQHSALEGGPQWEGGLGVGATERGLG